MILLVRVSNFENTATLSSHKPNLQFYHYFKKQLILTEMFSRMTNIGVTVTACICVPDIIRPETRADAENVRGMSTPVVSSTTAV